MLCNIQAGRIGYFLKFVNVWGFFGMAFLSLFNDAVSLHLSVCKSMFLKCEFLLQKVGLTGYFRSVGGHSSLRP